MAHIYMTFDFGTDEEKAQQARHKLDVWKQAFRLDKKLLYKFERSEDGAETGESELKPSTASGAKAAVAPKAPKAEKPAKAGKTTRSASANGKTEGETVETSAATTPAAPVKLHLRLAFSGHEKMTEERWLKRIPTEEPFRDAAPKTVMSSDTGFGEIEGKFDSLE